MLKEIESRDDIQQGKIIVDFYSKTCATCKRMLKVLQQVTDTDSTINVIKIDTSSELGNELAHEMAVSQLPSIRILDNGAEKAKFTGIVNINNILDEYKK